MGTITQREQAFFGGHMRRVLAGGDVQWGSPLFRVQEFAPSADSGVVLPAPSEWLQKGVPFFVVNTGTANLAVKRPAGSTVWTASPGSGVILVPGVDWFAIPRSAPQFGQVYPERRFDFTLATNQANVDLLQLAVASGYDGLGPAAVTCVIHDNALVGSRHPAAPSLTTGDVSGGISWAGGSYVFLVVEPTAITGGWGGIGGAAGIPGTGAAAGGVGGPGGIAIRAEIPLRIDCRGKILAGGGGGGGGGSSLTSTSEIGGGGGGGRGVNMTAGGVLLGSAGGFATSPASSGSHGSPSLVGTGGSGFGGGGRGGNGGDSGLSGSAGTAGSAAGGSAGAGAAAITYAAAAGAPTILFGASNILGSIVAA
jgi:hypothetical protein